MGSPRRTQPRKNPSSTKMSVTKKETHSVFGGSISCFVPALLDTEFQHTALETETRNAHQVFSVSPRENLSLVWNKMEMNTSEIAHDYSLSHRCCRTILGGRTTVLTSEPTQSHLDEH